MSLRLFPVVLLAASMCFAAPDGAALYKSRCAVCHDGKAQERMPSHAELAMLAPEAVMNALTQGAMVTQAAGLSNDEERAIASFVTGKEFSAPVQASAGTCKVAAKRFSPGSGDWSGWGVDPTNSHFQPKPGLSASEVPKLKLKWAFGFPKDSLAFSQPAVAGGRIFVGSNAGNVYSLDAATGCIYWTYVAGAAVRTAISLGKLPSGKWVAYFGDLRGNAQAVDAETGALIWEVNLDKHPAARITGSPVLVNGRLYVPVASIEEASATRPNYECCTFRGSLAALDAATGRKIWQTYTVPDPAKPYKKSKSGTQMLGPAGVSIWGAPTIDLKRKVIYASGGNSYTDVDVHTSDSIMAFDMNTGRMLWASQVQPKDDFIVGCPKATNCPESAGPDFDFGTAPVLRKLPNAKEILIAGQKSGVVYGLDPDDQGKILWQTRLGKGSALGGVEWGHAADNKLTYVAISDRLDRDGTPGIYALDFATGKQKWGVPTPAAPAPQLSTEAAAPTTGRGRGRGQRRAPRGQSAAVSVIPGVVFSGALDGHFRAYSASTGEVIWDFDTNRPFDTVNGVSGKGGSVDGPGPVIAHGMVFTNSGYSTFGGIGGNVLLAFSVDGK